MSNDLIRMVHRMGEPKVLVIGDAILDRYTWGDADRVSQEAPVVLLRAQRYEQRLGGAANLCHMLSGLGARAELAGVVGDDQDADQLRDQLRRHGVGSSAVLTDPSRPTTVKHRFMGCAQHRHPHQMLRVDREACEPLSESIQRKLLAAIRAVIAEQDIVLISDYSKGVCTAELLGEVIGLARQLGIRLIVDPMRGGDYRRYRGANCITPNRLEASQATGGTIATARDALGPARRLCGELELEAAVITLDKEGMALACSDGHSKLIPTRMRQVYDITGAGDMVLAVIGIALASGESYESALRLANVAGGLEVEKIGVTVVTREEMLADLGDLPRRNTEQKILDQRPLTNSVAQRRNAGQRIVFTNGCFDLLHAGHVRYLQHAAGQGDCLVVAINSDQSVRQLKGPGRPVVGQEDRATVLAALEVVDYVTVFDQSTPHELLRRLRPDVLVKGGNYSHQEIVGRELVESYGGLVVVGYEVRGTSSTALIKRIVAGAAAHANAAAEGNQPSDTGQHQAA